MADDTATLARPVPAPAPASPHPTDDLFADRFPRDPASPYPRSSSAKSASKPKVKEGLPPLTYALAAIAIAMLLWGAWVTKKLAAPIVQAPIASVRLEAIVSEYVQAQSHTNSSSDVVTRQTGAFMAALDAELKTRGSSGTTVLVGEAVLSQNVPDITDDIRKAVYAKVPLPAPVAPGAVAPPAMGAIVSLRHGVGCAAGVGGCRADTAGLASNAARVAAGCRTGCGGVPVRIGARSLAARSDPGTHEVRIRAMATLLAHRLASPASNDWFACAGDLLGATRAPVGRGRGAGGGHGVLQCHHRLAAEPCLYGQCEREPAKLGILRR